MICKEADNYFCADPKRFLTRMALPVVSYEFMATIASGPSCGGDFGAWESCAAWGPEYGGHVEASARVAAWMGDSTVIDGVHGPLWLRSVSSGLDIHVLGGAMRRACAAARGLVSKASSAGRRWTARGSTRFGRLATRCVWPLRIRSDARRSWAQAVFCGVSLSSGARVRVWAGIDSDAAKLSWCGCRAEARADCSRDWRIRL